MRQLRRVLWCAGIGLGLVAAPVAAQDGRVVGVVQNAQSGEPLPGAQLLVEGTGIGTLTGENGRFLLLNVPEGTHTVSVTLIGFGATTQQVTVGADQTVTADFLIEPQAVALTEIVVTGVVGATSKAKLPFEVASVQAEDLPVPAVNVASALQGKVAGLTVVAGTGQPGSDPSILLRGPKSLNAAGRSQEPLYVVDGVILSGSLADLGSLDIESVEILKGAAAASLYGSRAANGVIQVRTRRGSRLTDGDVRYTIRSEFGMSDLPNPSEDLLPEHHEFLIENGQFVNNDGTACDWLQCDSPVLAGQTAGGGTADAWNTFMTNPWPGTTYDQAERFFNSGGFMRNYVSASGRSGATNYHLSASNVQEEGVFRGFEGYDRTNFRLNVDQAVIENVHVQGSAFYSRSQDDQFPTGGILFDLTRMPAGVDLLGEDPDEPGEMVLTPDPTNTESPNPLYDLMTREFNQTRSRFLGSLNVRYSPVSWLDLDANTSFDRSDRKETEMLPKGYRTIDPSISQNNGQLSEFSRVDEGLNASLTASTRFQLTDAISNRTQLRYLYESQDREQFSTDGYAFAVGEVPVFANIDPTTIGSSSYLRTIRSDGYFAITNFDILDRYIVDALVRNDGSSLFGEDERRQWYYRFAGAWRVSQEPWFGVSAFDELKLRYSLGTAGGRPRFEAQYETYTVSGGRVSPVNLGNTDLKPEFSREHEAGIDASLFGGRVSLGLTYANTVTEDQILPVPLPALRGFSTQWRNAGTIESNTYEVTLEGRLVQTENLTWSARVLYDQTHSEITELNQPPFTYGVPGQALGAVFYARPGEEIGTFYGTRFGSSCSELPGGVSCDQFTVNDDGWLVYVGDGTLADNAWGTVADFTVFGQTPKWGVPFAVECTDRSTGASTRRCIVGNTMPEYSVAFSSTLDWRGFTVYGLLDAVQGFDVYNQPLQWGVFQRTAGIMDQAGVPEGQQKPLGYFDDLYNVSGLGPSNAFVEDASFVKLREVALGYRFSPETLSSVPGLNRLSGAGITLSGRNLVTWTDYRGFDPEVGESGGDTGSSTIARVEGYNYPNFRTFTASVELNF